MNFPKDLITGSIRRNERLKDHTSFRIGGPAALWVEPGSEKDLKRILVFAGKKRIPVFVMGGGSNILARDEGYNGIVIHLGSSHFKKAHIKGTALKVGAGYKVPALVRLCCEKGLSGLESLVGIPGTVGGAIFMNAGGWSSPLFKNIGDYVVSLKVMDKRGKIKRLGKDDIKFGYRRSSLEGCIILEAVLKLGRDKSELLKSRCSKFLKIKKQKQVLDAPSAGCVFKNPSNSQFTTGQMIDMLGLKGRKAGRAEISGKHANFIVNKGSAKSGDVIKLIDLISRKIAQSYGINLELEIKIV